MKRDKLHDEPRFGTMLMEPPLRRAHAGTMVLEPASSPEAPSAPVTGAPPFEPTHVLGADYAHLASFHEERTVTADLSAPTAEPLPFRAPSSAPPPRQGWEPPPARDFVTARAHVNPTPRFGAPPSTPPPAPAAYASTPAPPPYLGGIDRRDRTDRPSEVGQPIGRTASAASAYRNEPVAHVAHTPRPGPAPVRNDARASSEKRLSSLLHGPWLFPDDDD